MPLFKIVPTDHSHPSREVTATDAGCVLALVGRWDCGECDVLQDEQYMFSARLGANGVWAIFHRDGQMSDSGSRPTRQMVQ